jgi:hypothetical protein
MRTKKWAQKELSLAVKQSTSIRQVIKILGLIPAGGNYHQVSKYIKEFNIDIKHFKGKGWSKGNTGGYRPIIPTSLILKNGIEFQSYKLKNRLFKEKILEPKCSLCGWAKISEDGRLPLELDHINGKRNDNRIENLRILCPNCHSLQITHRGKNKKRS